MINYPIKFKPILQQKVWGGNKLKDLLNKDSKQNRIGESWEISGVTDFISIVENGSEAGTNLEQLLTKYQSDLIGKKNYTKYGTKFPLLIKFIDAKTNLSVQLHPNDELAQQRHNAFGKTEMWYVMQADKGAKLNIGFVRDLNKSEYLDFLERGEITKILNFEEVSRGDAFFVDTGMVHAIGAGILLAEIQQTSDITYRIYDWDRLDEHGEGRELHTSLALDAIDFQKTENYKRPYTKKNNISSEIACCEYFTTNYLPVDGKLIKDYSHLDSFIIYMCVDGTSRITTGDQTEVLKKGQSLLIPAIATTVNIEGNKAELLEVYIN